MNKTHKIVMLFENIAEIQVKENPEAFFLVNILRLCSQEQMQHISDILVARLPKNSWSREEVISLITGGYNAGYSDRDTDIGHGSNLPYALEQMNKNLK